MRQKTFILVGSLMLAGLIGMPVQAGIILRASEAPKAQSIQVKSYLSSSNEALKKALFVHNLMNEMPGLRSTAQTSKNLKEQHSLMKETLEGMSSCNSKKMGKVFKNPSKVWGKMMDTYAQRRQSSDEKQQANKTDGLKKTLKERYAESNTAWSIGRDIMMDVYSNPENWGSVKSGESFPLWKDQEVLFEQQWDQFYEKLNASYGAPLKGRPAVDEETRHNAQKYDTVLAAHKAYVAKISAGKDKNKTAIASANPPRAPKPLPKWQDIVKVDPLSRQVIPEMPEPWKQMAENNFENYSGSGEMGVFFNGKTLQPTAQATAGGKSELETEYEMNLALDSLDKGALGTAEQQNKMVKPFVQKLSKVGIQMPDFDISNRAQYLSVQKQLKEMKKQAIIEAYQYVDLLEKQDKEEPELVAKRSKLQAAKQARLSAEAQNETKGLGDVIQIQQMSPVSQQRLVLSALEKDEYATVFLTETNAINVDQMMREQEATDKIIQESFQQVADSMDKQRETIPEIRKCQF